MDFSDVLIGFQVAFEPMNLLWVFIGVVIGMVVGILPGLGPAPTIALLLPITFTLDPAAAIVMIAGVYYGAYYGGTITSVLLRLPGEAASVVTVYDGHQMALKGRAGPALGISAIGSFVGGVVATIGLIFFSPVVANYAVKMGPPEYVMLAIGGLLMVSVLGQAHPIKNIIVVVFGLLVASVGIDSVTGVTRFTFGNMEMMRGIDFVAVTMGLYGIGDILYDLEQEVRGSRLVGKIGRVLPTKKDMKDSSGAIARGSVIGFFLGLLPGGGGVVSSLASYAAEKKVSKTPEQFGKGAIAGVAGPETANNAGSTSAFLPLLSLGIPSNVVLALVYGALLIQGITPGPQLVSAHPEIFWGVLASMLIGNLMLLVLSMPLVGIFVNLIRVRIGILATVIMVVTLVGVYSINNATFDIWLMLIFGVIGYIMRKTEFDPGPMALAMVLGPLLETSFRQSMLMSSGSMGIFIERPFTLAVVLVVGFVIAMRIWFVFKNRGLRSVREVEHDVEAMLAEEEREIREHEVELPETDVLGRPQEIDDEPPGGSSPHTPAPDKPAADTTNNTEGKRVDQQ